MDSNIGSKEWRYRIGFDKQTLHLVTDACSALDENEKYIYEKIIEFYSSIISFDAYMNEYIQTGVIQPIEPRCLIRIPEELHTYYIDRINQIEFKTEEDRKEILGVYFCATASRLTPDISELFRIIFGKYLLPMTTIEFRETIYKLISIIDTNNILEYEKTFAIHTYRSKDAASNIESMLSDPHNIEMAHNGGKISGGKILSNSNNIIFEKNPAHIFIEELDKRMIYKSLSSKEIEDSPRFIDEGALCLIGGWITYCDWFSKETPASRKFNATTLLYLRALMSVAENESKSSTFFNSMIRSGCSEQTATSELICFSQYPGNRESYILGALWIMFKFNVEDFTNISDYVEFLKSRNLGDFFSLW